MFAGKYDNLSTNGEIESQQPLKVRMFQDEYTLAMTFQSRSRSGKRGIKVSLDSFTAKSILLRSSRSLQIVQIFHDD